MVVFFSSRQHQVVQMTDDTKVWFIIYGFLHRPFFHQLSLASSPSLLPPPRDAPTTADFPTITTRPTMAREPASACCSEGRGCRSWKSCTPWTYAACARSARSPARARRLCWRRGGSYKNFRRGLPRILALGEELGVSVAPEPRSAVYFRLIPI